MHNVFISYSNRDKKIADALCHFLEDNSLRCWYAPRDIPPGAKWAESIADAIENCRVFILVLSSHSNQSNQVLNEVNLAVKNKCIILTFKIDDVPLEKGLEYYLGSTHWIEAKTKVWEEYFEAIHHCICELCQELKPDKVITVKRKTRRPVLFILVPLVLLTLISVYVWRNSLHDYYIYSKPTYLFSGNEIVGSKFLSSDGNLYIEPMTDGQVLVRATKDKNIISTLKTTFVQGKINGVFSEDNRTLCLFAEKALILYDLPEGTILESKQTDTGRFIDAHFFEQDQYLVIFSGDPKFDYPREDAIASGITTFQVYDLKNGNLVNEFQDKYSFSLYGYTLDGQYLVGTRGENDVWIRSLLAEEEYYNNDALMRCNENVDFRPFSPDGLYFVIQSFDTDPEYNWSKVVRCADGKEMYTGKYGISLTFNGRLAVDENGGITTYDLLSGKKLQHISLGGDTRIWFFGSIKNTNYMVAYVGNGKFQDRFCVLDMLHGKPIQYTSEIHLAAGTMRRMIDPYIFFTYFGNDANEVSAGYFTYTLEKGGITLK